MGAPLHGRTSLRYLSYAALNRAQPSPASLRCANTVQVRCSVARRRVRGRRVLRPAAGCAAGDAEAAGAAARAAAAAMNAPAVALWRFFCFLVFSLTLSSFSLFF